MNRRIIFLMILAIAIITAMTGCNDTKNEQDSDKTEISRVVDAYLDNAAAGNWQAVCGTLTGEALEMAKANSGQVKSDGEKIITRKLHITRICEDLVNVDADFTKSSGNSFDRDAYTFSIIRSSGRWLIYKTAWGDYLHDKLMPGKLPEEAREMIKKYMEMPFSEKRAENHTYLTGKLLQDSEKSKMLPMDMKACGELQKTVITVKSIECLGLSADYLLARAACSISLDNTQKQKNFLIGAALVNGVWKI